MLLMDTSIDITEDLLLDDDFHPIDELKRADILKELGISRRERLITRTIIADIERSMADNIKIYKVVQIPTIGTYRRNPKAKIVNENRDLLKAIHAKSKTPKEYKDEVRKIMRDGLGKYEEDKARLDLIDRFKKLNIKTYNRKKQILGLKFADLWLYFMMNFEVVEFDQEIEDQYARLRRDLID